MVMLPDYHCHTKYSGDSSTPVRRQLEQAVRLGMDCVCVTDHHDYDVDSPIDFTLDMDSYMEEMTQLKEEYRGIIDVRIGVELGLQVHLKEYLHEVVSRYPFDFVIGSTHFIDRQDPCYPEYFYGREERDAYQQYFEVTLENVTRIDDYDVAGHIDYIVRYGPNKAAFYDYVSYRDLLDAILMKIIEHGKGIECNTAGLRKGICQPNPCTDVLRRYRELGGEIITIGSDAHVPEDLGADFEKARQLLLACGFRYYTVFKERKEEFRPL